MKQRMRGATENRTKINGQRSSHHTRASIFLFFCNRRMDEHKLQEILTCPVCLEIAPATPYWTCAACHHMVCDACCNRMHPWQCPTCRDKEHDLPLHNETLERMAEAAGLVVQCPNRGCGHRLPPHALDAHAQMGCLVRHPSLPSLPRPRRHSASRMQANAKGVLVIHVIPCLLVCFALALLIATLILSARIDGQLRELAPEILQNCKGYCTNTECVSQCSDTWE